MSKLIKNIPTQIMIILTFIFVSCNGGSSKVSSASGSTVNSAPTATAQAAVAIAEDGGATAFTITAGSDADGDAITYNIITAPSYGTVNETACEADITACTYTPDANFAGTDVLLYVVRDINGAYSASTTITFTVTGSNDDPTILFVSPTLDAGTIAVASTINENSNFTASITIDEGGGSDENSQGLTITVSEYDDCTTPVAPGSSLLNTGGATYTWGVSSGAVGVFSDGTASGDTNSFNLIVPAVTNVSGTGCIGVVVGDGTASTADYYFPVTVTAVNDPPTITLYQDVGLTTPLTPGLIAAQAEGDNTNIVNFYMVVDEGGGSSEDGQTISIQVETTVAVTGDSVTNLDFIELSGGTVVGGPLNVYNVSQTISDPASADASGTYTFAIKAPTNYYGVTTFNITATDSGSNTSPDDNTTTISYDITWNNNNTPTITTTDMVDKTVNVRSSIYDLRATLDEGGSGTDEDGQDLGVKISVTHVGDPVVHLGDISVYYYDTSGAKPTVVSITPDGVTCQSLGDGANPAEDKTLVFDIEPSTTDVGTTTVTIEVCDDGSGGATDVGTLSFDVERISAGLMHKGWSKIYSVGDVRGLSEQDPAVSNGDLADAVVTIDWTAFETVGFDASLPASITQYVVYRSELGGALTNFDFDPQSATYGRVMSPTTTTTYTDTNVTPGKTYWYRVRGVLLTRETGTPDEKYNFVRVVVPPANKALVHRWMANIHTCESMGYTLVAGTIDPENNFRCSYSGPGDTNVAGSFYYDLGYDLLVDRYEIGCPYTLAACEIGGTGGQDCFGTDLPGTSVTTNPNDDTIYYSRSNGQCYIHKSGSWTAMDGYGSTALMTAAITAATSYIPNFLKIAPLTYLNQAEAIAFCANTTFDQNITEESSVPTVVPYSQRLPIRKEQLVMSMWDSDDSNYDSNTEIDNIEKANSDYVLNSAVGGCNTNKAAGLTYIVSNHAPDIQGARFPGMPGNTVRMIYSGSIDSSKCTSRFGVQDMVGNMAEWSSDMITCAVDNGCVGTSTSLDIAATGGQYDFDGAIGPIGVTSVTNLDRWFFSDTTYNGMSATDFIIPLGLPAITKATTGLTSAVVGTDIVTADFHGDMISLDALTINADAAGDIAGLVYGGSYTYADCESSYTRGMCAGGTNGSEAGTPNCTGTATPNGEVTAITGSFFWDSTNKICYKNTDSATAWSTYSTGPERAGRYTLDAFEVNSSRKDVGFRCVIEIANPYP